MYDVSQVSPTSKGDKGNDETYLILRVRLQSQQTAILPAARVQDRRADKVPHIRVNTVQNAPLESLQQPPSIVAGNVEALEDLLRLARSPTDLLPALEEVLARQNSTFHVLVQRDWKLQCDGLQRTSNVRDSDSRWLLEGQSRFEHDHLTRL